MKLQVQVEPNGPFSLPLHLVSSWQPQVGAKVAGYEAERCEFI